MRAEKEVREKIAQLQSKLSREPEWNIEDRAFMQDEIKLLRWVLGEYEPTRDDLWENPR